MLQTQSQHPNSGTSVVSQVSQLTHIPGGKKNEPPNYYPNEMFIKWNQQKINYTKWQKENLSLASTDWQKRFVVVVDAKKRKPVDNFMMGTNWNQNRQLKKKKTRQQKRFWKSKTALTSGTGAIRQRSYQRRSVSWINLSSQVP